ncbi:hypothetical protein NC652_008103 [Populus alba x Populus x berolinensis]|nr:hypothetical protein NC652_008103 [Populus alba x Populus x berolinensis]
MQKCMASNGVQSSVGLQAALPPVSGVTRTIPNTVFQNPNMQSIPGVSQNSVGNSMGQGIPSTMFANSQRQMPGLWFDSYKLRANLQRFDRQPHEQKKDNLRPHQASRCSPVRETEIQEAMLLLRRLQQVVRRNKKSQEDKEDCFKKLVKRKLELKEWLRVHGDHVKSEAVEKANTQGRLLKKVDLLAPISML